MKNLKLYLLVGFITITSVFLFLSIRYFYHQNLIENKVLALLPASPDCIIRFNNPEELYNQYLSQNILFKKIHSRQKDVLIKIVAKLDSLYRPLSAKDVKIQSFYSAHYIDDMWLLGFAAYQTKDVGKIQKYLKRKNLYFKEIDGNFLIAEKEIKLNQINTSSSTNNNYVRWMNIFSKKTAPLDIYQKNAKSECAYQVYFKTNNILLNGFVKYTDVSNYSHNNKLNLNIDENIKIQPFNININDKNDESVNDFLKTFQQHYLHKKISIQNCLVFPFDNTESTFITLKNISDSNFIYDNVNIFKIKPDVNKSLATHLKLFNDTSIYASILENNLIFTNDFNSIIHFKKILSESFSETDYYLLQLKNTTSEDIENSDIHQYLPVQWTFQKDSMSYDFNVQIYSSLMNDCFAFQMDIQKNNFTQQYLWTYLHPIKIQKLVGTFDDHKTHTQFVLFQDSIFNLICLNANGEKLWEYPLKSLIQSPIFIVDILKNNKHQMLFNTEKSIYLLDRNGKNVGEFPVQLISKITNPINVIDYEGNKNYRVWFSTQNHYTYNYTLDGKMAEQYRPYYCDEWIVNPIKYVSIGLSDYLVLITNKGRIIGISRKGDGRLVLKKKLPDIIICYYFDVSNTLENSYIYYVTPKNIERISFNNQHKIIYQWNASIVDAQFFTEPLIKTPLIAVLDSSEFKLLNLKGDILKSIKCYKIYQKIDVQPLSSKVYFLLSKDNSYDVVVLDIDKNFQYIVKNILSDETPIITSLFNENTEMLIYMQGNKIYCKKI